MVLLFGRCSDSKKFKDYVLSHCSMGVHESVLAYKNFPCLF